MPSYKESTIMGYNQTQIFNLVADVESYPEFLPWCAAARIRKEIQKGEVKQIEADLIISFKVFREKFGSRVLVDPDKYIIETDYIDGPFRYMHSVWSFRDSEEGCEVKFNVDFEFKRFIESNIGRHVFRSYITSMIRLGLGEEYVLLIKLFLISNILCNIIR